MVSFACLCLGVCVGSKLRGLHLMWWRRLSALQIYTYKCLGSERVVWEWTRICCSSSLRGYSPPSYHHTHTITPSQSFCYSSPAKKTTWNLELITSNGSTLTEPSFKAPCDPGHLLNLRKLHVIVLHSVNTQETHSIGWVKGGQNEWMAEWRKK